MSRSDSEATVYNSNKDLLELDVISNGKPQNITRWKAILITGVIYFLCGIENALTGLSEWPYMHTIDRDAPYSFFGIATSISKWGTVVFTLVFSFWNYKFQTVKWPLIAGRVLATLGSLLYVCVELFPTNRRYVMFTCYIIFSIATSSTVVVRPYIVFHSSEQDRSRAWSVLTLANAVAMVTGPLIQLAFSGIDYPGKTIIKGIYFNLFSAPIWVATIMNIFTVLLIFFALPEMPRSNSIRKGFDMSWATVVKSWKTIRGLEVSWILVVIVVFQRFAIMIAIATLQYLISPMFITIWGMDNQTVVKWISGAMGVVGALSIATSLLLMATPLSKIIPARTLLLIAFVTASIMYVLAYPYPFTSHPIPPYNVTDGTGCNPEEYSWCGTRGVNIWVFMSVVLVAVGIALPTSIISLDSIYSKVVGEANQSVMQGLVTLFDTLVNVLVPFYTSEVYTLAGPTIFWIINGCFTIVGTIVWIVAFRWMRKY